jgi:hypothetical protein
MKKITIGANDKEIVEKTKKPESIILAIWYIVRVDPIIYCITKSAGKQISNERNIRQGILMPVTILCRNPL